MKKNIKKFMLFYSIFFICSSVVRSESSDVQYITNIQNYIDSIKTTRMKIIFMGETAAGFEGHGLVNFKTNADYDVLFDVDRNLWKVKIHEENIPTDDLTSEEIAKFQSNTYRTIAQSTQNIIEYFPSEMEFGPQASVWSQDSDARKASFAAIMQRIDPRKYLRLAIPGKSGVFERMEKNDNNVTLHYKHKTKKTIMSIVLAEEWEFLPVKIQFSTGFYCNIAYKKVNNQIVVHEIQYFNNSGKAHIVYEDCKFNDDILDEEFAVDIPPNTDIFDHIHEMDIEGQQLSMDIEKLIESGDVSLNIINENQAELLANSEIDAGDGDHGYSSSGEAGFANSNADSNIEISLRNEFLPIRLIIALGSIILIVFIFLMLKRVIKN